MAMREIYTHGHHEAVLDAHRARTATDSAGYLLPYLTAGQRLLDVGCGPGTITVDLATRVAPGEVLGVDASAEVVAAARAADGHAVAGVRFEVGDVTDLRLPAASFDVVHAHQVLQHLADPVAALRQMRRVCRPGGIVAARDGDYASMTWYPHSAAITAWLDIYRRTARRNGGQPDAGRRLASWARRAGFDDVTATASTWCYATPARRAHWAGTWARRVTRSALADQAVGYGYATRAQLAGIADGWLAWAEADDGWFAVLHGEVICRVPIA